MTYYHYLSEFSEYHKSYTNIIIHLFTVHLGFYGLVSLLSTLLGENLASILIIIYGISLYFFDISIIISLVCSISLYLILTISSFYPISMLQSLFIILISYLGQDFAHYITSEKTYQSSYINKQNYAQNFIIHNYLLLPLTIDIGLSNLDLKTLFYNSNSIINTPLDKDGRDDCMKLASFYRESSKTINHTIHHWYNQLPLEEKHLFLKIKNNPRIFKAFYEIYDKDSFIIEHVHEMDEVYISILYTL